MGLVVVGSQIVAYLGVAYLGRVAYLEGASLGRVAYLEAASLGRVAYLQAASLGLPYLEVAYLEQKTAACTQAAWVVASLLWSHRRC